MASAALRPAVLLREGVSVLAVDIDEERLKDCAAEGCETMVADLADPAAREPSRRGC